MKLLAFGVCCMCLSVWGVLQLSLMGLLYHFETPILIEDTHAHKEDYTTFQGFISKTRENYKANATNCWIAAGVYGFTLLISVICIHIANKSATKDAKALEDDEIACSVPIKLMPTLKKSSQKPKSPKKSETAKTKPADDTKIIPSGDDSKNAKPSADSKKPGDDSKKPKPKNDPKGTKHSGDIK